MFNDGDPPVVFYPGTNDSNGNLFAPKELNPRSGIELPPSESQCIGFNVRTFGTDSDEFDNAKLVIKADADVEASNPPQPGLNVHIDKKSTTDGKLSLSGTIKNNAPSSKNIDVALEVQGANIDPDKQTIHAVSDGSETDFSFRNVDVSDLAPDNYTVVVTATTNGVAPVSDSAKFDVTASADSIELVVGSVGTSDSRLEFEIKNQGSQTVITGIRFDNSSTNVVRVLSGASDEKSEVAFINNDGEEPKPGISLANSSKQYSLFFFNTGPDGGFKRISGNQSTPSETNGFYPFKEDVTGWKSNNNQINAGKPKLNSGSTTVINIGEFRSGQGTGNRKVDLSNKNVTLTLKFGDGSKKQFEFINIPQKE